MVGEQIRDLCRTKFKPAQDSPPNNTRNLSVHVEARQRPARAVYTVKVAVGPNSLEQAMKDGRPDDF